jgi:hypothetical protein
LLLLGSYQTLSAQEEGGGGLQPEEPYSRSNFGLKMGLGWSEFFGGELQNPRPAHGFVGGFYAHSDPAKLKLGWQLELLFRLRGSNFANADLGNTSYTKINFMSIDLPIMTSWRLSAPNAEKFRSVLFGLNVSYIFKSVVYQGEDRMPVQFDNWNNTWSNLPVRNFEFGPVLAYQYRGQIVGWQVAAKVGMNDLNRNFVIPQLLPKTGTGKPIRTMGLEFSLLF